MKILDTSLIVDPGVQQPFTGPSLKFVEDAYKEALSVLARMPVLDITKVIILYGCTNSTPGTTTFTISAGAVYYNGEIYLVPAATLTTSGNVVLCNLVDTNTLGNQTFSDGIARTTSHDRTGVWALGTSGTGTLSGNSASDFNNTVIASSPWIAVTGGIGFQNSWADDVSSGNSPILYKIDNGFLVFKGRMSGGATTTTAFTLPSRFRPAYLIQIPVIGIGGGGSFSLNKITFDTAGLVAIGWASNGNTSLDGVRIPLV